MLVSDAWTGLTPLKRSYTNPYVSERAMMPEQITEVVSIYIEIPRNKE